MHTILIIFLSIFGLWLLINIISSILTIKDYGVKMLISEYKYMLQEWKNDILFYFRDVGDEDYP